MTVVPDLFQKDPISSSDFDSGKMDMSSWLAKHTPERTDPIVARTINYVREDLGAEMIGAIGYCFGAKVSKSWFYVVGRRKLTSGYSNAVCLPFFEGRWD